MGDRSIRIALLINGLYHTVDSHECVVSNMLDTPGILDRFAANARISHLVAIVMPSTPFLAFATVLQHLKTLKLSVMQDTTLCIEHLTSLTELHISNHGYMVDGTVPNSLEKYINTGGPTSLTGFENCSALAVISANEQEISRIISPSHNITTLYIGCNTIHHGELAAHVVTHCTKLRYLVILHTGSPSVFPRPGAGCDRLNNILRSIEQLTYEEHSSFTMYEYGQLTVCSGPNYAMYADPTVPTITEMFLEKSTPRGKIPDNIKRLLINNSDTSGYEPNNALTRYRGNVYAADNERFINRSANTLLCVEIHSPCPSLLLCQNLTTLSIEGYPWPTTVPTITIGQFRVLPNLETFTVSGYHITDIHKVSRLTVSLKRLTLLDYGRDSQLPLTLSRLVNLTHIRILLSTQLPDCLDKLPELRRISIRGIRGGGRVYDIPRPIPYSFVRIMTKCELLTLYDTDKRAPFHPHLLPMMVFRNATIDLGPYGYTAESATRVITNGRCDYDCYCTDHFLRRYATPDSYFSRANRDIINMICDVLRAERM